LAAESLAPEMLQARKIVAAEAVFFDFMAFTGIDEVWIYAITQAKRPYGSVRSVSTGLPFLNLATSNVIAVQVDTRATQSRWYTGSGIYRNGAGVNLRNLCRQWGTLLPRRKLSEKIGYRKLEIKTNKSEKPTRSHFKPL
jgi:hypothetical protein